MDKIKNIRMLKVGDDVLFQNRKRNEIRWVGKVNKINNGKVYSVKITHLPLFKDDFSTTQKGNFGVDWNDEGKWVLYKITNEELLGCKKELILINLK